MASYTASASIVLILGGGDLASGVALRLQRAGINMLVTELPQPLVVRRLVSFAQAVYAGTCNVEESIGRLVDDKEQALKAISAGEVPVIVDPDGNTINTFKPDVIIDARMTKQPANIGIDHDKLVIGLGPGFSAGVNCHAVIETKRGHSLGRVLWKGAAIKDTGIPESVGKQGVERVLRAPASGELNAHAQIGDKLKQGDLIAEVAGKSVKAPFDGALRGLIYTGIKVYEGMKIGDLDARGDPAYCTLVSDKALAIGGGVLEAILSKPDIRAKLWD